MSFTPEELAELAAADAQIEADFELTYEEVLLSRELDDYAIWQRSSWAEIARRAKRRQGKQSERQRGYQRANYRAHRDELRASKKAWYAKNRDAVRAQQKAYRKKKAAQALEHSKPPAGV